MNPSLIANLAGRLQDFDRRVWPAHRIALPPEFRSALDASKLVVADVGAASGPEDRWRALAGLVHFLTFEPMPRDPAPGQAELITNFPMALGSQRGRAKLQRMRDPDASTLYPVNHLVIDSFAIADGLTTVGVSELELDTLDHCLEPSPQLSPDFLKVDVEGADLEVLRGATAALQRSVFGVRIEMSFLERHQGAPLFGHTDDFLRTHGFALFQLSRERWVRRNLVDGFSSQPQLAWGDAVYFLSRDTVLDRLRGRPERERELLLLKWIAILLAFGVHDYAVELIDLARTGGLVGERWGGELSRMVLESVDRSVFFPIKSFLGVIFAGLIYLLAFPLKSTRQRATFYLQQRTGHFSRILMRLAGRSGPQQSCLSD
jgi:FkbM family methyltransferase